jgi:hypothetical protein
MFKSQMSTILNSAISFETRGDDQMTVAIASSSPGSNSLKLVFNYVEKNKMNSCYSIFLLHFFD